MKRLIGLAALRCSLALAGLCAFGDAAAIATPPLPGSAGIVRLLDLKDRSIDPFDVPPGTEAVVFLFVTAECPISNRYAPDIRRLYETLASRQVRLWLVYPNPADSPAMIRQHISDYEYPGPVLRDPRHTLVTRAGITVTPEAAVYDAQQRLAYRGRIDNRYESLTVRRPQATTHDLEQAVAAVLAGDPTRGRITHAVGCFVADFVR